MEVDQNLQNTYIASSLQLSCFGGCSVNLTIYVALKSDLLRSGSSPTLHQFIGTVNCKTKLLASIPGSPTACFFAWYCWLSWFTCMSHPFRYSVLLSLEKCLLLLIFLSFFLHQSCNLFATDSWSFTLQGIKFVECCIRPCSQGVHFSSSSTNAAWPVKRLGDFPACSHIPESNPYQLLTASSLQCITPKVNPEII